MKLADLKNLEASFDLQFAHKEEISLSSISHAENPLANTFCFVKDKKFLALVGKSSEHEVFPSSGVVFEKLFFDSLETQQREDIKTKFLWSATVDNISAAMCSFSEYFYEIKFGAYNLQVDGRKMGSASIDPSARIAEGVFIGEDVTIEANVTIMPGCVILPQVAIGKGTIIFPNVTIYSDVVVGKECRVHSGTVIGSDGFGYNFFDGKHQKIWHLYGVQIGNYVEVGGNTTIDCGAFTPTVIEEGTKIDNFVQISHNAHIGKHNIMCGKSGVAGSTKTGDYCVFGGDASCAQNVELGNGVHLAARAVVSENSIIKEKVALGGHPARPIKEWLRSQATLRKISKR